MLSDGGSRQALFPTLVSFVQLMFDGATPPSIRPFFFGANLTALHKKQGGIRPIAVSCTLCRLTAKVAGNLVMKEMGNLLAPRQLGFGVRGGGEAAVHAVRLYLHDIVHSVYSSPSSLFWSDRTIQSAEGVQQGDPLGPLLFCLSIHRLVTQLNSELSLFYLDDGTLGGDVETLLSGLEVVKREGARIELQLNVQKSEIICADSDITGSIQSSLPGALVVEPFSATLLGSPIGDVSSISATLTIKTNMLRRMGERLQCLTAQDALLLLKHSFALPKVLYNLRTAPCFLSPVLQEYDELLKSTLSGITNIHFQDDDPTWTQATLPVKLGGLGIRSAVQLAPSAFLASAAASSDLVHHIVPLRLQGSPLPNVDDASVLWSKDHNRAPPEGVAQHQQKTWDIPKTSALAESLLENAPDPDHVPVFLPLLPGSQEPG